ncbi:MAG: cytochrome C [Polyangiaceae bacterium]|nr:cytochrome C [Polyangiaceae bacterium]
MLQPPVRFHQTHLLTAALLAAGALAGLSSAPFAEASDRTPHAEHQELSSPGKVEPQLDESGPGQTETARTSPLSSWSGQGCTQSSCHGGIEKIRSLDSPMMKEILARGVAVGDPDGCVPCHGGQPRAKTAAAAHQGAPVEFRSSDPKQHGPQDFYSDPSSPWINEHSCGPCHLNLVQAQWSSLMMTEAGKIQGTAWGFGALEGYEHRWGNYDYTNPEDPQARLGSEAYQHYMSEKSAAHPQLYVNSHETLPAAPQGDALAQISEHPEQAAFTYLRAECQRCHLGVKGRKKRGDFRGMGCSACHVPYSNEGLYEGNDLTIPKDEPGHALVHSLQGTRQATVTIHEQSYRGIPVETCSTCHNRGKRIGVSYQGLMESAYGSPYTEGGGGQLGLHSKHYLSMEKDIHYQKGMLCQDCHTSVDVHGDRFLAAANLAAVEIECTDCHGTPQAYPWELPLGWGDENAKGAKQGPARGISTKVSQDQRGLAEPPGAAFAKKEKAQQPPREFLLSARGNPMPDIERRGQQVIVHTAAGKDLTLEPLRKKLLEKKLSPDALTAMVNVSSHIDTMECYTCHSSWAPQCYGCHIKIDYSEEKASFDWVMGGHRHLEAEHAAEKGEPQDPALEIPGSVQETRSYLRFENPVLGVNGEGRVTPLIPGCQTSVTIIDQQGQTVTQNKIFKATPGAEGSATGQLGSDMSPVQPHTVGKSRSCESCHASQKALGYGIGGESLVPPWNQKRVVDLTTADGRILPQGARTQIEAVEGLKRDWSAIVTKDGEQLQTVGHHFLGSGPLSAEQREKMDRRSTCVGCHQTLPEGNFAAEALHHAAVFTGQIPYSNDAHRSLLHKITNIAAWAQVLAALLSGGAIVGLFSYLMTSRRRKKS